MDEQTVRRIIREELSKSETVERYLFQKHLQIFDGRNIQVGRGTGTKLGTATDQKIAFHGKTPVIQANAISAPSGGATVDAESRNKINEIRTVLSGKGFTA